MYLWADIYKLKNMLKEILYGELSGYREFNCSS